MRKDIAYRQARELIYGKDKYIKNFIDDMLIKCNQMFHYENLPREVPKRIIEQFLTEGGYCIFTKENERYVVFQGGLGGETNEYYEPTKCIVANPYLKINKEYTINSGDKNDCVLIRNDSKMKGLLPIIARYAVLCCDTEISLNMLTKNLRTQFFISASDDRSLTSAREFIRNLDEGNLSVIAENAFLDGIKTHSVTTNATYIQQFVELNQYFRAIGFNEIGLDANFNMKRERLNESEVDLNTSILIPLAEDMLECRKTAIKEINDKYGLDIKVDLSSVWKMQKESVDKATETEETQLETENESESESENESESESENESESESENESESESENETEEK